MLTDLAEQAGIEMCHIHFFTASLLHLSNGNVNHTEQASQSNTEEQRKDVSIIPYIM